MAQLVLVCCIALVIGVLLGHLDDWKWAAFTAGFMFLLGLLLSPAGSSVTDTFACQPPIPEIQSTTLPDLDLGPERPSIAEQAEKYERCQQDLEDAMWALAGILVIGGVGFFAGRVWSEEGRTSSS